MRREHTQRGLPNILIFNPDQWRGDVLGHVGNSAAVTPVLDELVRTNAVSFRNAFCQNPVCTPSRCSFMSGWYPHVRGHRTMFHMLRPGEPNLLRTLKEAGYRVWWGGKNDLVPGQEGYDAYCDVKYEPPEPMLPMWGRGRKRETNDGPDYSFYAGRIERLPNEDHYHDADWANVFGAVEFIKNEAKDGAVCVYLPLIYPHPPYAVEEPWHSVTDRDRLPDRIPAPTNWTGKPSILPGLRELQNLDGWTENRWTELRATYYGMCARVDYQFGLVLRALREADIYDNTAVFFFSDHGDFTGDYGLVEKTQNTFEDCLTRVPLIVKPPAGVPVVPRVSDALVELIDVPATVEALTGIEPGHTHFGGSLLSAMVGETDEHRDAVFCEGGRLRGETHAMELESPSSRDSNSPYWPRMSLQKREGSEHTKAAMCRTREFKYVRRLYETDELYNLREDPEELHNRVNDPALSKTLVSLKERLLTWYQETSDVVPHDTDRRR